VHTMMRTRCLHGAPADGGNTTTTTKTKPPELTQAERDAQQAQLRAIITKQAYENASDFIERLARRLERGAADVRQQGERFKQVVEAGDKETFVTPVNCIDWIVNEVENCLRNLNLAEAVRVATALAAAQNYARDLGADDPITDVVRAHGGVAPDTKPEDR
jgi:Domain of unknown function (DUF892)